MISSQNVQGRIQPFLSDSFKSKIVNMSKPRVVVVVSRRVVAQAGSCLHLPQQQHGAAGRDDVLGAGGCHLRRLPCGGGCGDTQRSPARHHTRVQLQHWLQVVIAHAARNLG